MSFNDANTVEQILDTVAKLVTAHTPMAHDIKPPSYGSTSTKDSQDYFMIN